MSPVDDHTRTHSFEARVSRVIEGLVGEHEQLYWTNTVYYNAINILARLVVQGSDKVAVESEHRVPATMISQEDLLCYLTGTY